MKRIVKTGSIGGGMLSMMPSRPLAPRIPSPGMARGGAWKWVSLALVAFLSWGAPSWADPVIRAEPESHDFGRIIRGDRVSYVFHIHNKGKSRPLDITLVKTSCGCSTTFLGDTQVPPGQSTPLEARFDSTEFLGKVHKTIFIYSNDPDNGEYAVTFTAEVRSLVEVEPEQLNLGTVDLLGGKGMEITFHVVLSVPDGKVTGLEYNKGHFEDSCGEAAQSGGKSTHDCRLTVKPGAPSGSILEELVLRTNLKGQPFYKLNIFGKLKGAFDLLPMLVDFGELKSSDTVVETVTVSDSSGKPFRILRVTPDRPEITHEIKAGPGSTSYDVVLKFAPATLTEVVEGKIKILTDDARNPYIQLKYQAFVE